MARHTLPPRSSCFRPLAQGASFAPLHSVGRHAKRLVVATAGVLFAVAGCSGRTSSGGGSSSSAGGNVVNGTIAGSAVPIKDSMAVYQNGPDVAYALVVMTDAPNICASTQHQHTPPGSTSFSLGLVEGLGITTLSPGMFQVSASAGEGNEAVVGYEVQDSSCSMITGGDATSGTVTLTSISSTSLSGTFDVTFPSGDEVTGSFDAPVCPLTADAGTAICGM